MTELSRIHSAIRRQLIDLLKIPDINDEDDFFDLGASSLTVILLQVRIEKEFGAGVPTIELMRKPTLAAWAGLYSTVRNT